MLNCCRSLAIATRNNSQAPLGITLLLFLAILVQLAIIVVPLIVMGHKKDSVEVSSSSSSPRSFFVLESLVVTSPSHDKFLYVMSNTSNLGGEIQETIQRIHEEAPAPMEKNETVEDEQRNGNSNITATTRNTTSSTSAAANVHSIIVIDPTNNPDQIFQRMQGFGYSLTGGSAQHIMGRLATTERSALLKELFQDLRINTLRLTIGASDLDPDPFSYNDDLPPTSSSLDDPDLTMFTMEREYEYRIPLLKEIQALHQPNLTLWATPWSAPWWMKDNRNTTGGRLLPQYYETYANYLVRYLQTMEREGLPIQYMTLQNEPMNGDNNPSMVMSASEQAILIRDYLVPAMANAGLATVEYTNDDNIFEEEDNPGRISSFSTRTQLVIYDHNADHIEYPLGILDDPTVAPLVEGSAFHLYAGDVAALSQVHDAHPTKSIHFTEQWVSAQGQFEGDLLWHAQHVVVGATRNYARTILEWTLASHPSLQPHTVGGGCSQCLGAITIDDTNDSDVATATIIQRNAAYYVLAHVAPYLLSRPSTTMTGQEQGPQDETLFSSSASASAIRIDSYWEAVVEDIDEKVDDLDNDYDLSNENGESPSRVSSLDLSSVVDHVAFSISSRQESDEDNNERYHDERIVILLANRADNDLVVSLKVLQPQTEEYTDEIAEHFLQVPLLRRSWNTVVLTRRTTT